MDSIADVVTFGIAPAVLAYVWGVLFVAGPAELSRAGYSIAFFFLLCGAVRLARFNVQAVSPKPDMRYFVGMPIPAAAGFVAAAIHLDTDPVRSLPFSIAWLCLLAIIGLLMVSTWRYPSFKQLNIGKPRTPLIVLLVGGLIFVIFEWSQIVLMGLATAYLLSGILIRLASFIRRLRRTRASCRHCRQGAGATDWLKQKSKQNCRFACPSSVLKPCWAKTFARPSKAVTKRRASPPTQPAAKVPLGEQEGEAVYIEPFSAKSLAEERMVVLAGSKSGAEKSYQIVQASGPQAGSN